MPAGELRRAGGGDGIGRRLLVLLLALLACGGDDDVDTGTGTGAEVGASRELFAGIDDDDQYGCSAAVGRDGEVVWAEAFGGGLDVDTAVDIASVSKQFTATAVLLLDIDLESTLDEHIDGLPRWAAEVTVWDLVHMRSGIPDYLALLDDAETTTNDDAIDALRTVDELEAPDYSNSNYVLLAEIVERRTGEPFADWLDEHVFGPVGLDADVDPRGPYQQYGDGGIRTTPSELVEWAAQYWAPSIGDDDIVDERLDDAETYGAGIIAVPDDELGPLLFHDGEWDHVTTFDVLPEQRLAAAVTCTSPDMPESDRDNAYRLLEIWI